MGVISDWERPLLVEFPDGRTAGELVVTAIAVVGLVLGGCSPAGSNVEPTRAQLQTVTPEEKATPSPVVLPTKKVPTEVPAPTPIPFQELKTKLGVGGGASELTVEQVYELTSQVSKSGELWRRRFVELGRIGNYQIGVKFDLDKGEWLPAEEVYNRKGTQWGVILDPGREDRALAVTEIPRPTNEGTGRTILWPSSAVGWDGQGRIVIKPPSKTEMDREFDELNFFADQEALIARRNGKETITRVTYDFQNDGVVKVAKTEFLDGRVWRNWDWLSTEEIKQITDSQYGYPQYKDMVPATAISANELAKSGVNNADKLVEKTAKTRDASGRPVSRITGVSPQVAQLSSTDRGVLVSRILPSANFDGVKQNPVTRTGCDLYYYRKGNVVAKGEGEPQIIGIIGIVEQVQPVKDTEPFGEQLIVVTDQTGRYRAAFRVDMRNGQTGMGLLLINPGINEYSGEVIYDVNKLDPKGVTNMFLDVAQTGAYVMISSAGGWGGYTKDATNGTFLADQVYGFGLRETAYESGHPIFRED